jgi:hypothetical protein
MTVDSTPGLGSRFTMWIPAGETLALAEAA